MTTLYHYPLCPFSRKIRLFLGEQKIGADLIVERFWENRKEFIKLNPSGEDPVMLYEGNKFCGHYAISEYIENKFKDTLPKDLSNRAENRRLIDWFDNKFHKEVSKVIINERVEKRFRSLEKGGGLPNTDNIPLAKNYVCTIGMRFSWKISAQSYVTEDGENHYIISLVNAAFTVEKVQNQSTM